MFFRYFRRLPFICHQCGTHYRPTINQIETIYDPHTDDPLDPPYIACPKCFTGVALPLRYTNNHGVTFITEQKQLKNGRINWSLTIKPAPV